MRRLLLLAVLTATASAQWTLQASNTVADLRGVDNVGGGVAWASGTSGTVLRTIDGGVTWTACATPPGAEKLDFRGVQAFDATTAVVMSSGKGDLSRLYKTTDGCKTWTLIFTNPDKDGFWDAIQLSASSGLWSGPLLGDPVNGKFPLWWIVPGYRSSPNSKLAFSARQGEAAFAASNTSIFFYKEEAVWFATGGQSGARVVRRVIHGGEPIGWVSYPSSDVPVGQQTESSGIFSLSFAVLGNPVPSAIRVGVAVGGDYLRPNEPTRTAALTKNGGRSWQAATTPPHGYRSAVAYDANAKTWITVGPNGTDTSTDDGRNWRPLRPTSTDAPDADKQWNALSLPFVVGPHGRIGILNPAALQAVR